MKSDLTEIVCVIDRSGSMETIRSDAIGGFNSFLSTQQEEPGAAKLTLVLFNHDYHLSHDGIDIQAVEPLNNDTYVPVGTTALLDAVGKTISEVGNRLHNTPEKERPTKVIVAILTDGLENASREFSQEKVFDMITHQRENYNWEFLFLAANQDAIAAAESLSIQAQDTVAFAATSEGINQAYADLDSMVSESRRKK